MLLSLRPRRHARRWMRGRDDARGDGTDRARRVFGGAHPLTTAMERNLDNVRAALRARAVEAVCEALRPRRRSGMREVRAAATRPVPAAAALPPRPRPPHAVREVAAAVDALRARGPQNLAPSAATPAAARRRSSASSSATARARRAGAAVAPRAHPGRLVLRRAVARELGEAPRLLLVRQLLALRPSSPLRRLALARRDGAAVGAQRAVPALVDAALAEAVAVVPLVSARGRGDGERRPR